MSTARRYGAPRRKTSLCFATKSWTLHHEVRPVLDAALLASRLRNTCLRRCSAPGCSVQHRRCLRSTHGNRLQRGQHGSSAGSGGSLRTPVSKREPRKDAVDRRFRSDEPASLHERIPDLCVGGWLGGLRRGCSRRRSCARRLRGSRARRRPERSTASTRAVATAVDAVLTRAPVRPHPVAPVSGAGLPNPPHRSRTPRTHRVRCSAGVVRPYARCRRRCTRWARRGRSTTP